MSPAFPFQEGTFFGNIIDTGALKGTGQPTGNGPVAHDCDGDCFATGCERRGGRPPRCRLFHAPYTNPFGDSGLCKSSPGSNMQWSAASTTATAPSRIPTATAR